jgi:hypothetical protein
MRLFNVTVARDTNCLFQGLGILMEAEGQYNVFREGKIACT